MLCGADMNMFGRDLASTPLSPSQRKKLLNAAYKTTNDVWSSSPEQLAKDLDCSHEEAMEIFKALKGEDSPVLGNDNTN